MNVMHVVHIIPEKEDIDENKMRFVIGYSLIPKASCRWLSHSFSDGAGVAAGSDN
jgi:hypothetical protein